MSDSVNPAGSRPGGGRGYGGGAPARPDQAAAQAPSPGVGPVASPIGAAQPAPPQVSGFGRTLGRVSSAVAAGARLDPWSVMKVSFVLSIALGIVTLVGTAVVWEVLNALGVFASLNKTVGDLTSGGSTTNSFNLASVLSFTRVEGYMLIVALVDVVLVTALATLAAYLYNLSSGFVGGLEVTLAEDQ